MNRNPVPRRTRNFSSRGALNSGLASADSGLQLDLEIALSGVSAKVQPHGLFQPGRRCVETSDDVIEDVFTSARDNLSSFIFTRGVVSVRSLAYGCGRTNGSAARDSPLHRG